MATTSDTTGQYSDLADKTGEFFTVGGPLHAIRSGYIRRAADEQLVEHVMAHRYSYIAAPNRTGKSSLIVGAAARLENNGYRVAVLDLEQISSRESESDPGRWYYNIAYRLLRQLRIRFELQEWWQDKSVLSNRQRLLEFYSEILLSNIEEDIVIILDSVQCVEELPFADQLLASIRSAYNGRGLDPDFMRLVFVLAGEFDPQAVIDDAESSPFAVSKRIRLYDFTREEIAVYGSELGVPAEQQDAILDRIFYWTDGHPYLTQKLARACARTERVDDPESFVDGLVRQQFAPRSSVKNEPHMSHLHRRIVGDRANREALLNLFGRIRKGVAVATDLGEKDQRRLIALGLVVIDDNGNLTVRNRLYESVFTARWANENLPVHWRAPAYAAGFIFLMIFVPFWYTQRLPNAYVDVLTDRAVPVEDARSAWTAFRSFPGHTETADNLFRTYLVDQAAQSTDINTLESITEQAVTLGGDRSLADQLASDFWMRRAADARRKEDRDDALLATIESLTVSTRDKRRRAAALLGSDYPLLVDSLATEGPIHFDSGRLIFSALEASSVRQWTVGENGLVAAEPWQMTALEVQPVVRRVVVDAPGNVRQIGLRLRLSHQRLSDLSIRLSAPSGQSVSLTIDQERGSVNRDIVVDRAQLAALIGESQEGTWSLSIRDQGVGVAGFLVGWTLSLNSQALVEDFQRGVNIPNPIETPAADAWVDPSSRFVAASSLSGDSLRLWDLGVARPLGNLAISAGEVPIGFDRTGSVFVSASQDSLHFWRMPGREIFQRIAIDGGARSHAVLPDSNAVLTRLLGDDGVSYQLRSIVDGAPIAALDVAGAPQLEAFSADGRRVAIADFDRSVRVWDVASGELVSQIDLAYRPSSLKISPGGDYVAVVYAERGVAQWSVDQSERPVFELLEDGKWAFEFSPSGRLSVSGRSGLGFQVRRTIDGSVVGPLLAEHANPNQGSPRFSNDEEFLVTASTNALTRVWRVPETLDRPERRVEPRWSPAFDSPLVLSPNGERIVFADRSGIVHAESVTLTGATVTAEAEDVSYIGHDGIIRHLDVHDTVDRAASIGDDNLLRTWSLATGQPSDWSLEIPPGEVRALKFAPSGEKVAVLLDYRLLVVESATGEILEDEEFSEEQVAFVFLNESTLYLGGAAGTLSMLQLQSPASALRQVVWAGDSALDRLTVSPDGAQMIIADRSKRLLQFDLQTNQINESVLRMPSQIRELVFGSIPSRLFVRTDRWMHSFSTSQTDILWNDSVFLPGIPGSANTVALDATSFQIPVVRGDSIDIVTLQFADGDGAALFGNRSELLSTWTRKLGRQNDESRTADTPAISTDSP